MFNFFIKEDNKNSIYLKITCLLIHAAKIDEFYTDKEKELIKKTLLNLRIDKNEVEKIIIEAEKIESNSNQILEFTKEVKNMSHENKIKIVETLWKIIYSNNVADIYETGLMRKLAGLLYIDSKTMGNIKKKIEKEILL